MANWQQRHPESFARIQTHASSILEGEGQDEHDPALVEAVARALAQAGQTDEYDAYDTCGSVNQFYYDTLARAALSTIRKHEESHHD